MDKIFTYLFIISVSSLLAVGFFTFIVADNFFRQKDWYLKYKRTIAVVLRIATVVALLSAGLAIAFIKIT